MSPLQEIINNRIREKGLRLFVKREDLVHPYIQGNKWRKLKYNLEYFNKSHFDKILTFGGAYSNHIEAVATAGEIYKIKTIGIIRGERPATFGATLRHAEACGMELHFVSRADYRNKNKPDFLEYLKNKFDDCYILPEGGSNALGVKGCVEIVEDLNAINFDIICVPCGTGATMAGIILGLDGQKRVLGFPALKGGDFLVEDINNFILSYSNKKYKNWNLQMGYHFGGYAKFNKDLLDFIINFKKTYNIQLEPVYTGKMLFGIFDLIEKDFFEEGTTIVAIHTGGLQGLKGFRERFGDIL